jgi:hypothetical protein
VTGHFAEGVSDEVLLVASQTTNEQGELRYAILSLSDGSVISEHTLDCSFALTAEKAGIPVALSVRNSGEADSVILYFHSVQAVYEGNAQRPTSKTQASSSPPTLRVFPPPTSSVRSISSPSPPARVKRCCPS